MQRKLGDGISFVCGLYFRLSGLEQDYCILKSYSKVDGRYLIGLFQILESPKHIVSMLTDCHLLVHLEGKEPPIHRRWLFLRFQA
jgi:hypothetical protein